MDRRYVVPALAGVVALLLVGLLSGAFTPLLTTDGYQPVTPEATDGTATDRTAADETATAAATATPTRTVIADGYAHTSVTVVDAETGDELGSVRAAVAESYQQKYTGLSKTESLPPDVGMLFPYDSEGSRTYVMRNMDFGIDIVYIAGNGTITRIHHAPEPPEGEDGESYRYPGYGQYVLEVNYEWTTRHGVTVGDEVEIGDW
jgi:hypothetical protein